MSDFPNNLTPLQAAHEFTVMFLAFTGRDHGTPREDKTMADLQEMAAKLDTLLRSALVAPPLDDSKLKWHLPENLRWLAQQDERPDRMPTGDLTGSFLTFCADRFEEMVKREQEPSAGTDAYEMVAAVEQRNVEVTDTLINMVAATVLSVLIDEEGGGRSNITFSPKAMDDMHSRYEMSAKRDGLLTTVSIKPRPEAFPPLKMENADGFGEAEPQAAAHEFDLPVWAIRYFDKAGNPYLAKMLDRADAQRHLPDYVGPFDVPEPTIENRCCLHPDCPNTQCNHDAKPELDDEWFEGAERNVGFKIDGAVPVVDIDPEATSDS